MARKSRAVVEDDDLELEELEEVDETPAPKKASKKAAKAAPAEAPAKKSRKAASEDDDAESSAYGAAWLADYVNEQVEGKNYSAANIRVLLRKLAADGTLDREVGTDRSRYSFSGPNDPIVKAVVKHVKAGTLEAAQKARLEAVASKKADAAPAKKAGKKASAPVVEEDDEDEEEIETPKASKKATRRR